MPEFRKDCTESRLFVHGYGLIDTQLFTIPNERLYPANSSNSSFRLSEKTSGYLEHSGVFIFFFKNQAASDTLYTKKRTRSVAFLSLRVFFDIKRRAVDDFILGYMLASGVGNLGDMRGRDIRYAKFNGRLTFISRWFDPVGKKVFSFIVDETWLLHINH